MTDNNVSKNYNSLQHGMFLLSRLHLNSTVNIIFVGTTETLQNDTFF